MDLHDKNFAGMLIKIVVFKTVILMQRKYYVDILEVKPILQISTICIVISNESYLSKIFG